ncbi:T7SS effector LXG polymorphic toxin [Lentibacillus daqui]|uniref:T7SS effector LXG polymorphic toxin n=1 Tax=Lentibacillus daqui TaxID=2911514 RepID=UPI0022B0A231|nr:T7SS effector LXG polymorphic toxin [Lentibacillus daqui]
MANKVDMSEVNDFSKDLQEASADFQSQLDKVIENIETINGMDSFSGKAAKEAKQYFGELHVTLLDSFKGLFDDLEGNLQQHIDTFESDVDSSDSAIIKSNYLKNVKKDINEVFEDLEKQDEIIHDIIGKVNDISSVTPPSFTDVVEWKKKAVKKITELDEDLSSFNGVGDETDVKQVINQIETVMNNAKASEGKARFADFEGASEGSELAKLKSYSEGKKEEQMEKAKNIKESALKELNKPSSREVVNKAYTEFKNGEIDYDQFTAILNVVKSTNGNMSEEELKEESTDSFIKYLEDHDMLEQYLDDHQTFAEYVVKKMPKMLWEHAEGYLPIFLKKSGLSRKELADYLMESEKEISSRTKVADLNFYREIKDTYKQSDKLLQFSKYAKGAGKAFGWAGVGYGFYDDVANNGKTAGEAVAHSGTVLAIGTSIALAFPPGGVAVAVGVGATAAFEFLYSHNTLGLQDSLDKAGEKISEWGKAAGDFFKNPGESIASGLSSLNPFA